ncbi:MAG TPA: RluA family pseudouridine synthase, partial [Chloroflexia bacterium]|nr:RluA family pseudouridine synthase [Chloroflexia bacterium]
MVEWQVGASEAGERLDRAITAHLSDFSRSYAATLIEAGAVTLNGNVASKPGQKIRAGDHISINIPAPQPSGIAAEEIPLSIVYEDADLLVIDKPAGMVVHPAPGHAGGTLVNALLAHVPELELNMGDEARPGIVHRLDKDTSGLLVVAKRRPAHEALSRQMSARTMLKQYLAVVAGKPNPPAGIVDAPIARDPRDRQRMAIVSNGRPARTRYATERDLPRYTLI